MSAPKNPFRLNVGFIVHQGIGYSREFEFEFSEVHLPPDLDLKNLTGTVRVTRTPQGLPVQVKMRATVDSECVRCLTDFEQPLEVDFTELYAFSERSADDSGLLLPEDGRIDLAQLVREYMLLEIPISPMCSEDCQGMCPICGEKIDEFHSDHDSEAIDPRLSVLKKLLEQDEEQDDTTTE